MENFYSDQPPQKQPDNELYAMLPVVEQIRTLHAKGQYGFDICPQNVVTTRRGALLRVKSIALNANGSSVFRPGFTPRERYMGGAIGPWTDIYGVSSLVYTALTGLLLPSAFERGNTEPLFGGLDLKYRALEEIVARGLSSDAAQRPSSLDALSTQMKVCLCGYTPTVTKRTVNRPMTAKRTAIAVGCIALLLLGGAAGVNEINYSQAEVQAQAGEFTQAQDSLKGVFSFYKDAAQLKDYVGAGVSLQSGVYDKASEGFSALDGYKNAKEMLKETKYRQAQALIEQGSLTEAEEQLRSIGDYKDAAQQLKQISYENGKTYLESGLYLSALEAFQNAGDYEDAAVLAEETKDKLYGAAIGALETGDTDTAGQYFAALKGYKQADKMGVLTALLVRVQSGERVSYDEYSYIMSFADTVDLSAYSDQLH